LPPLMTSAIARATSHLLPSTLTAAPAARFRSRSQRGGLWLFGSAAQLDQDWPGPSQKQRTARHRPRRTTTAARVAAATTPANATSTNATVSALAAAAVTPCAGGRSTGPHSRPRTRPRRRRRGRRAAEGGGRWPGWGGAKSSRVAPVLGRSGDGPGGDGGERDGAAVGARARYEVVAAGVRRGPEVVDKWTSERRSSNNPPITLMTRRRNTDSAVHGSQNPVRGSSWRSG
jgi:hypothetical protein